jgi:integration host factor subunit alpha
MGCRGRPILSACGQSRPLAERPASANIMRLSYLTEGDTMAEIQTLTRADLSDVVHREIGLSRADSAEMVEQVLGLMCGAMASGENVKISGFGTFVLRDKGERVGRNPKTGIEVPIAPRRVLTFRASNMLRDRIAEAS